MGRVAAAARVLLLLLLFCLFMPKVTAREALAKAAASSGKPTAREILQLENASKIRGRHQQYRLIPDNDLKAENVDISKVMTCSDVFLVYCHLNDEKIQEFNYKQFFLPNDDGAFPVKTFVQCWEDQRTQTHTFWENDFRKLLQYDRKFAGQFGSDNVWMRDARLDVDDNIITPCTTCFERADYGNMLVDSVFKWKCFPPFYPRHTLHYHWFVSIDNLRNNTWKYQSDSSSSDDEEIRISTSIEIKTLLDAVMGMLEGLRKRVHSNQEHKMTIVDEIYLTEQLCNALFGILYIVSKKKLTDGKWYEWGFTTASGLKDDVEAFEFDEKMMLSVPDNLKNNVLSSKTWETGKRTIEQMITHCKGMDFNLPYLRCKELRRNKFAMSWPKPEDKAIYNPDHLKARIFPF